MMKHLLLFIVLFLACPIARAQSFDKLWKNVEEQQARDLPQSALSELAKIRSKALKEGNDAQLLRCVLVERQLKTDIAPDSSRAVLSRMEAAYAKEQRPLVRALWQSALGQVYAAEWGDTAAATRAHDLLIASVSNVALLGQTHAELYMPLFTAGNDSRYYNNDLLHVLAQPVLDKSGYNYRHNAIISAEEAANLRQRMLQYYKDAGNQEAALLTEIAIAEEQTGKAKKLTDRKDFQTLCRLKEDYKALELNVETYIRLVGLNDYGAEQANDSIRVALAREGLARYGSTKRAAALQNYIQTMELPTLQLTAPSNIGYPDTQQFIKAEVRNVRKYMLTVYRTPLTAADLLTNIEAKYIIGRSDRVQTVECTTDEHPAYVTFSDSIPFLCGEPGIYVLRLSSEGLPDTYAYFRSTRLRPLSLRGNLHECRVTPVDAQTGKPLMNGKIQAYNETNGTGYKLVKTYTADSEGNIFLPQQQGYRTKYLLVVGKDAYFPTFNPSTGNYRDRKDYSQATLATYTDRAIYRPGQKIQFGVVAYTQVEDEVTATPDLPITITLHDANGTETDTLNLTTDALGTAGGTFTLPTSVLPGTFHIRAKSTDKRKFSASWEGIRVEEYKRPTFTAELLEPDCAYKLGDSIRVEGKAETYTGLPLRNATVKYTITSGRGYYDSNTSLSGEATTDENGRFFVPVTFKADENEDNISPYVRNGRIYCPWHVHHYDITADVTAQNGETQSANRTLYASQQPSWLAYDWQETICRENLPKVTVWQRNSPWRNITGTGSYEILKDSAVVLRGNFRTGEAFTPEGLGNLPSGQYNVRLHCADLNVETLKFTLMSEKDTKPWGGDAMTYYVRKNEAGDSAYIMAGSPHQNVTLFYDLVANGKIIDSKRYKISGSIEKIRLNYKESYGDGARAVLAFVLNGKLYSQDVTIQRPVPDKRLQMHWTTFRSKLQPGSKEEWRLKVTRPDGTAANASVMACLYDASLNELVSNNWDFSLSFPRTQPQAYYLLPNSYLLSLNTYGKYTQKNVPEYAFTQWRADLFASNYAIMPLTMRSLGGRKYARMAKTDGMVYAESATAQPLAMNLAVDAEEAAADETADSGNGCTDTASSTVKPRKNFAETAFFAPALRTDSTGETALVFTLPESLTTWQFRAWAHDTHMNYGRMDTTVVARKEFMVQANMPRFLRDGDRASIPVTLTNLSDKAFFCGFIGVLPERIYA